jgi:CubicO group peptidase (beta-lactamase class C family)
MDPIFISKQLQRLVDSAVSPRTGIRNAIMGISYGEKFQWAGSSGIADSETGRPMDADTPFLIASITKMYTAAAVLILQARGKLHLDEKIAQYIPDQGIAGLHHYKGSDYTGTLTIRHLITQTSGLPDYFLDKLIRGKSVFDRILSEGDRAWELEDVIQITRSSLSARFPPANFANLVKQGGKRKAHYSDTNYKLLGLIIETVEGNPLEVVFQELFFAPFDLRQTYLFCCPHSDNSKAPARVYYKDRMMKLDQLMSSHGPEGGIVSMVGDVLRFGKAYFSGELFEKYGVTVPVQQWNPIFFPFEYGYGLMRFKLPRLLMPFGYSPELVGHSGSSGSFLYYDRGLDLYMAGTVNQMAQRNVPFQLMLKTAQMFQTAAR